MTQNQPVREGRYAITIDVSTKGWHETRCAGSLMWKNGQISVLPPGRNNSQGYPASIFSWSDNSGFTCIELHQQAGDRRTMVIWKKTNREPAWEVNSGSPDDCSLHQIVMYPQLEALLNQLAIQHGQK